MGFLVYTHMNSFINRHINCLLSPSFPFIVRGLQRTHLGVASWGGHFLLACQSDDLGATEFSWAAHNSVLLLCRCKKLANNGDLLTAVGAENIEDFVRLGQVWEFLLTR